MDQAVSALVSSSLFVQDFASGPFGYDHITGPWAYVADKPRLRAATGWAPRFYQVFLYPDTDFGLSPIRTYAVPIPAFAAPEAYYNPDLPPMVLYQLRTGRIRLPQLPALVLAYARRCHDPICRTHVRRLFATMHLDDDWLAHHLTRLSDAERDQLAQDMAAFFQVGQTDGEYRERSRRIPGSEWPRL